MRDKSCSPYGAEGPSGEHEDCDEVSIASSHLWQPLSLAFTDSKERQFHNMCYPSWLTQDFAAHSIGLVIGTHLVFSLNAVLPKWQKAAWLLTSWGFVPVNIYAFLRHREIYARYRLWSILFVRLVLNLVSAFIGYYLPAPDSSFSSIFLLILSKSPVTCMFFTSLVHRLEFRYHILIHFLALIEAFIWIPPFCRTCSQHPGIGKSFNQVGYGIDWIFSYTILDSLPDPTDYPCWMMTTLFTIVVGFVIPTFLVFVTEVSSRSLFLHSRLSSKFQVAVSDHANAAFRMASFACLSFVLATWFVLCLIRDYFVA